MGRRSEQCRGWATESEEGVGRGRCAAAGCGRFVRAGEERCPAHGGTAAPLAPRVGGGTGRRTPGAGEEGRERRRRAAAEFRRRLEDGEYRGLFGQRLGEVLAQAAVDRGLGVEIGALRVTLARLLVEEQDPQKLAASVARVAGWRCRRRGRSGRSAASWRTG